MATASNLYTIFQGAASPEEEDVFFLGLAPAGDPLAVRRLVHPNASLAPISYFSNPHRTLGLDNDVLPHPITDTRKMLEGTAVIRFENAIDDVIVTEIWNGNPGRRLSIPGFFFRALYEYLRNEPPFDAVSQEYVQWEPQDRTTKSWNIRMLSMTVGGGDPSGEDAFDVLEFRPDGGGGNVIGPIDDLDVAIAAGGGFLDSTVTLRHKIVSEVT
jgi:hypothetical protein